MRFKLMLNNSLVHFLIPLSQLHTLKSGLSESFNLPVETLDENILWDIREGRMGGSPEDPCGTKADKSLGKIGVAPLVIAYLSDSLTRRLAEMYDHVSPHLLLDSGPRSLKWNVLLVPDALETVHEYPFLEHRGYLQSFGDLPRELATAQATLDLSKYTPPSAPEVIPVDDVDVNLLPQNDKFVRRVVRGKVPRMEPVPNILWRHKPELDKLYREHRASK